MKTVRPAAGRALATAALALALLFLAVDSAHRLRAIATLSSARLSDAPLPAPDAGSSSGFAAGQRRLVLPAVATDGYHWLLQTERILAGDGLRVRSVAVDNAPHGREVHWSSPLRWWLASLAHGQTLLRPGLTAPQALERVAAGANTALLALLLVGLTPLVLRRFGAHAAAVFALAWVAVWPLYEGFLAGMLDHHGLIFMSTFAAIAAIAAGGAGWVRLDGDQGAEGGAAVDGPPHFRQARRWFIAGGVAAGVGLWLSAMSLIPVLAGIGLAALLGTGALAGGGSEGRQARPAPELWRVWGAAGAATSLAAWGLEYVPHHMSLRLEVNHPLYALAWLAAGDLLARLGPHHAPSAGGRAARLWPWAGVDALVLAAPPLLILMTRDATFGLADPFLRGLHRERIVEFGTLAGHHAGASLPAVVQSVSVLPLLLLPAAALLAHGEATGHARVAWRALAAGMGATGFALLFIVARAALTPDAGTPGPGATLLALLAAAAAALLLLAPLRRRAARLAPHERAMVAAAAAPAAVLLVLTLGQIRWLGSAAAALLALLVVLLGLRACAAATGPRSAATALFLALLLLPFPLSTALFPWRFGYPLREEAGQLATREIAYLLRQDIGHRPAIIASGPTTTTWLVYFGGFRGLGTLYWENRNGLAAHARLFGAASFDEARRTLAERGVTHIVLAAWDPPVLDSAPPGPATQPSTPLVSRDAYFLQHLWAGERLPSWIRPIPLQLQGLGSSSDAAFRVYEIVP